MAQHQGVSCRPYARSQRHHLDNLKTVANGLLHARDAIYPTVVEPQRQKNCCQVEMWRRCISNSDSYMAHPIFTTLDEDIIGGDQKAVTMDASPQDPGNYLSGSPFTSHNNFFYIRCMSSENPFVVRRMKTTHGIYDGTCQHIRSPHCTAR